MGVREIKRVNFVDGQNLTVDDFIAEQNAWTVTSANNTDVIIGSGIKKEFSTQRVLFDLSLAPSNVILLVDNEEFDGEPIYHTDTILQPSDAVEGNQLEVQITGANISGSRKIKFFIFGLSINDKFVYESIEFNNNGSKTTKTYFTKITAFVTQNFRGNQYGCENVGGNIKIMEAMPYSICPDHIMIEQGKLPNIPFENFIAAQSGKTIDNILSEIAAEEQRLVSELEIITEGFVSDRVLGAGVTGLIVGQKFIAKTNNIQKISLLLSVQENTAALAGHEFDWSGDLVIGIRPLQRTVRCPIDVIPNNKIEHDPEPYSIAEVSISQTTLANSGIYLTDTPRVVDFVFAGSPISNPGVDPSLAIGEYYVVTVNRAGDVSQGNVVLVEANLSAANIQYSEESYMSVFSGGNWTDITDRHMWFKIYTSAIFVTSGTALDNGYFITSPKSMLGADGILTESYINGTHSLIDSSANFKNYIVLQKENKFSDQLSHPATGNRFLSRITDYPGISIIDEDTIADLITSNNEPIILGYVTDTNAKNVSRISGTTEYPWLAGTNTFTLINPTADVFTNNLIGAILTPNTNEPSLRYRIIDIVRHDDAYGDVNGDTIVNYSDALLISQLDGYSPSLNDGTVITETQQSAAELGIISIPQLLKADVLSNGYIDAASGLAIQDNIDNGTAFVVGSSFVRAVITVEHISDPIGTAVNLYNADPELIAVPFQPLQYEIEFQQAWEEDKLHIVDMRRYISQTFTEITEDDLALSPPVGGKNSYYVPGNLILGGNILDELSQEYRFDLEVSTITFVLPNTELDGEFNLFDQYIKNLMRFYDGTLVGSRALQDNQVRVSLAIQSITKDIGDKTEGEPLYDFDIVGTDPVQASISVAYSPSSGVVKIHSKNNKNIGLQSELSTKLIATVHLKKAGFINSNQTILPSSFPVLS